MLATITSNQTKMVHLLTIELIQSVITLSGVGQLMQYQQLQLKYYGFKGEKDALYKETEGAIPEIVKLISYLEGEQIEYALSEGLSHIIEQFRAKKQALNQVFNRVKMIKDGQLVDEHFNEFVKFASELPRKLKPHQLKSAYHFYALRNGANFSVPGSGKTSTVLAVYEKFRREGLCNILFIVGPPSCFQPWQNEFRETLDRTPDVRILSGGSKSFRKSEYQRPKASASELYLCTFHTALNDTKDIVSFLSQNGINAFLVVDEAHYMKQLGGSWANSLLAIGRYATCRGILTGTPIPKSYKDLFNLFDFLWDGDSSLTQDDKVRIGLWEKQKKTNAIKQLLNEKLSPLFYRVRKKDLGLMPAYFHAPIVVPMHATERSIYDSICKKITDLSVQEYHMNDALLSRLRQGRMIRLRQAVSYPALLASAIEESDESLIETPTLGQQIGHYDQLEIPGKLQALTELVHNIRQTDRKILIWSNFVGTLEMIRRHLESLGYRAEIIYGKTPIRKDDSIAIGEEKTREDIRDEFLDMDSDLDFLIANPAACAESISLHKTCYHAIYYDLSYNCSQYLQSLDRIHRVGGSEHRLANYYFLQYENSIDQDIRENLLLKAKRMYEVIDQDFSIYDLDLEENADDDIKSYIRIFTNRH